MFGFTKKRFLAVIYALLLSGCAVQLEHIGAAEAPKTLWLPKGFHAPYGQVYASTMDIMNRLYQADRARYNRGIIGTGWYNYKYVSYPWGVTRYKYRILVNITRMQNGYGLRVRVPVEKESGDTWKYVDRDRKIEKKVYQDVMRGIMQRNYGLIEIPGK
jgi:hypothetical protein